MQIDNTLFLRRCRSSDGGWKNVREVPVIHCSKTSCREHARSRIEEKTLKVHCCRKNWKRSSKEMEPFLTARCWQTLRTIITRYTSESMLDNLSKLESSNANENLSQFKYILRAWHSWGCSSSVFYYRRGHSL